MNHLVDEMVRRQISWVRRTATIRRDYRMSEERAWEASAFDRGILAGALITLESFGADPDLVMSVRNEGVFLLTAYQRGGHRDPKK